MEHFIGIDLGTTYSAVSKMCIRDRPNTSHSPLYFNADHKLEYTSVRKVSEITHYDVYEYFETVHRLMTVYYTHLPLMVFFSDFTTHTVFL